MASYIPYVIEQTGGGERSYDIFSRLLKDRIILLGGEVTSQSAELIVSIHPSSIRLSGRTG